MNEPPRVLEPVPLEAARVDASGLRTYVEAAFAEHRARVFGLALATTRDRDVAADITQDAFIRLLQEARAGRHPDNVGAWLHRTTANLVISRARRTAVAQRLAPRLVRGDEPTGPEGLALEHERSAALRAMLATLSPTERTALTLAAQGVPGEEIARILGKSHGATRTLLLRARRRLRELAERGADR